LAAIVSAIDVLQAGAKDDPERDVFLGHIDRETHRLARLAQALLILARAQTGFEAPRDEIVPLAPVLREVAGSLRPTGGVEVHVSCPDDLALITNQQLVEQALLNVADNAAKYTTEGRISLSARAVDGAIEIVVADTGPGIPADEQSQIFDRFYRGSANGAPGFGLGFAIVRSAVEALDGELELSSSEGSGTTVLFRLPRAASMISA
jgi:signal transduction histidine kinase